MIKKLLTLTAIVASGLSFAQSISAGSSHSLFLCSTDTVKSWGNNSSGQLGLGDRLIKTLPNNISNLGGITAISASQDHSLFLKNDGTAWAVGYNFYGALGIGNTTTQNTPVQIAGLNGITAISAGDNYSLFLKNDGTVYATGKNNYYQLGIGNTFAQITPVQIAGLNGITAISAGSAHSLFLKNDGTVWVTGNNNCGQLGIGNVISQVTPVQIAGLNGITAISAGGNHSLFLKSDGTIYATGFNAYGQLGIGSTTNLLTPVQIPNFNGITAISASITHSLFLKNDGTVWAAGRNVNGQLGIVNTTLQNTSVPLQVAGLNGITAISAGADHSLFLKNNGTVYATGNNSYGQLGIGNKTAQYTPQQLAPICAPPTPPQASISVPNNAVCEGSNVNISATIVGSNPDFLTTLDNSITLNNPIAIDKNSHAVFVLNNNNSVTAYNFNGTVYNSYPNLTLTNIWAFTIDENDNLYINNGSTDGSGNLEIHKCDNTGALIESIPNGFMNASNLVTDLLFYNHPGSLENMFYSDTLNGAAAVNATNMNDNFPLANSIAFNLYNKKYTSLSMDNFYADKRLLMADPANHILASTQMFNNVATDADTLIDAASTAGMGLDYIYADTTIITEASAFGGSLMMVSSRTTGIVGLCISARFPDGTTFSYIDTTYTSYFNAVAPVGGVFVKNGNLTEYWVADNGQNKLLRLSLASYSIVPTLPSGLTFNAVSGVIEGTPTTVTANQTYTLTVNSPFGGSSSSTFTLGVNPSSGVSNTPGTSSSNTIQNDGTTKNYTDQQNCTQLVVITDFVGGTSPGFTRVEQTVSATGDVTVGNAKFVRRVNKIEAEQTENINAKLVLFYTYQDMQAYNAANPTNTFTNDTIVGSMQMYMLHMHEKYDTVNGYWIKEPTHYGPIAALWIPNKHVWETTFNVNKLSEFYAGPSSIASTFNCANSAKDTIVANDFYIWNYPDSLFTSGDYVDTLVNKTGCDSIVQLHLIINITTGLNEAALASGISVFPNPSTGVFMIRFNTAAVAPSKVKVISVIGTELMSKTITSSDQIDLSPFQSGIYYLTIENEGATKTWRIVKQ